MVNISGFGVKVNIVALQTFPMGFTVSKFTDDTDAIRIDPTEPVGYDLQFDGSIVVYDKASVIRVSLSVIPNTDDDINLKLLLQARKGGFKWLPIQDVTSMIITYPDGGRVALSMGTILSGPFADSIQQSGRRGSNTYDFVFAAFGGAQNSRQLITSGIQSILGLL